MIGVATATESFKDISREMAWVSFGAFILVSIIVLIVLTEGEALTGLDGFDIPRKRRVKKIRSWHFKLYLYSRFV